MLKKELLQLKIGSVVGTALVAGVLLVMATPSAMAQGRRGVRCDRNSGSVSRVDDSRYDSRYNNSQYYNDRTYNDRYYTNNQNGQYRRSGNGEYYNDRYYNDGYYYENENTTGKALKRVGIGAAIGAGAGVLLGGKTGAIVGAGAGGLGGYIYHRGKVNGQQSRYPY